MAFEVSATKFRPQKLDSLIGQEFVVSTLKNSIINNKLANAYLLSGARGCGKTSTARILAKSLNCLNGPTIDPCNKCHNCISITNSSSTDVIEIDGASNTSINDIKVIQEEILYPPVSSKFKIYIIDEVHMLSNSAFNALLKTIEEPPANVIFIFATTEINKVPATIRSRCQQFNLRLIPKDLIFNSLKNILDLQNIKFEDKALFWISNEGKGSLRDSYTLLDQVISFSEDEITLKKIQEKLGLANEESIIKLVESIISQNREALLKEFFILIETGISPEQIIIELIKFFKNQMYSKINISSNLFDYYYDKNVMVKLNSFINLEEIENIIFILFSTYEKLSHSNDIQTEVEICLLKLLNFKYLIKTKDILFALKSLNDNLVSGKSVITKNEIDEKEAVKDNKSIKLNLGKSEILKELKKSIPTSNFQLLNALNKITSIEESGNQMVLYFSEQICFDSAVLNKDLLEGKLFNIIGKHMSVKLILNETKKQQTLISEINKINITNIFNGKEIG